MDWQLEPSWKLILTSSETPSAVMLKVEGAPPSGRTTKLTDVLALSYAALKSVEDSPWMDFHLTSGPKRLIQQLRRRALLSGLAGLSLGGVLFCGGCFLVWDRAASRPGASEIHSQVDGPSLANSDAPEPGAISYPFPNFPFAIRPSLLVSPSEDEVEINGGCWITLEQKPPCLEVQAEYKGECWLPISKERKKTPRSQNP